MRLERAKPPSMKGACDSLGADLAVMRSRPRPLSSAARSASAETDKAIPCFIGEPGSDPVSARHMTIERVVIYLFDPAEGKPLMAVESADRGPDNLFLIMAELSVARSAAGKHRFHLDPSSHWACCQCVFLRPSLCASAFIIAVNACTLPATPSASTMLPSLAETVTTPSSSSATEVSLPFARKHRAAHPVPLAKCLRAHPKALIKPQLARPLICSNAT